MEATKYDDAERWCHETLSSGKWLALDNSMNPLLDELVADAAHEIGCPFESLFSLLHNIQLVHIKQTNYRIRKAVSSLVQGYLSGNSIVTLAREYCFPPFLMARLIVEHVAHDGKLKGQKKKVTEAMRDPMKKLQIGAAQKTSPISEPETKADHRSHLGNETNQCIDSSKNECRSGLDPCRRPHATGEKNDAQPLSRLQLEVLEAIRADPFCGPRHERERRLTGLEYEIILEQTLIAMNIPFETEEQLRLKGTAKTPDILLSCPVGVKVPIRRGSKLTSSCSTAGDNEESNYEYRMICWMDSKALFGDVQTHQHDVLPQVEKYVNRFGPGLVLYWFGHAPLDRLGDGQGDVIVVGWNIPEYLMLPTGELVGHGSFPPPSDECPNESTK